MKKYVLFFSLGLISIVSLLFAVFPVLAHDGSINYAEIDDFQIWMDIKPHDLKNNTLIMNFQGTRDFETIDFTNIKYELTLSKNNHVTHSAVYTTLNKTSSITIPDNKVSVGPYDLRMVVLSTNETGEFDYGEVVFENEIIFHKVYTFLIDVDDSLVKK